MNKYEPFYTAVCSRKVKFIFSYFQYYFF